MKKRAVTLSFALAQLLLCGATAEAHEKWFYRGPPTDWSELLQPPRLVAIGAVIAVVLMVAWVWRMRRQQDWLPGPAVFGATPASRKQFYAWVPAILAVHVAVPLLVYGLEGQFFSPNNIPPGTTQYALGLLQVTAALSLVYGGMTRLGAILLAVAWLRGVLVFGPEAMLENAHYLGFAAFFFLAGRGPYSIDRLLFPKLEPRDRLRRWALPALRVCIGISLITVAFTEKLANLPLAIGFLQQHPLNFTPALGLPLSDELFALCAGAVELLVGLCVLFGLFPRTTIVIAWLPFNLTLLIFDWVELVGHLPFYGAFAVLLIWTPSDEDQRLWLQQIA